MPTPANNPVSETDPSHGYRILGIAIVQLVGGFLCFGVHVVNNLWGSKMDERVFWGILTLTTILFIYALSIALASGPVIEVLRKAIPHFLLEPFEPALKRWAKPSTKTRLRQIIVRLGTLDIVVLGICILYTGGSQTSVYTPLLCSVVSIIIIINSRDRPLTRRQLLYLIMLCVFFVTLGFCPVAKDFLMQDRPFDPKQEAHAIILMCSMLVGSFIPALYALLEQYAKDKASGQTADGNVEAS
jgi:hypothetical protein